MYIKKLPKIFFNGKITESNKYFKTMYLVMEHKLGRRQSGQGEENPHLFKCRMDCCSVNGMERKGGTDIKIQ